MLINKLKSTLTCFFGWYPGTKRHAVVIGRAALALRQIAPHSGVIQIVLTRPAFDRVVAGLTTHRVMRESVLTEAAAPDNLRVYDSIYFPEHKLQVFSPMGFDAVDDRLVDTYRVQTTKSMTEHPETCVVSSNRQPLCLTLIAKHDAKRLEARQAKQEKQRLREHQREVEYQKRCEEMNLDALQRCVRWWVPKPKMTGMDLYIADLLKDGFVIQPMENPAAKYPPPVNPVKRYCDCVLPILVIPMEHVMSRFLHIDAVA